MPLLDHFHPPLNVHRHAEGFHNFWASAIAGHLTRHVLPKNYIAEPQIHVGGRVEVDVATFEQATSRTSSIPGGNGGVAVESWAPPATSLVMPAFFSDELEILIFETEGGLTLVAAIELVSPANKDRPETRRAFAVKCANFLYQGIGLVIVDIVSSRHANLHDTLIDLLQQPESFRFPDAPFLYATAYRPARREPGGDQIDIWQAPLTVGHTLPTMPLALRGGPTLPLDLETSYSEARENSRL
ncbi:hypothetical protein AYO40_04400 [Planctomycetaceae bacterium SCGC AG-212-D15]|nr:hypothetical protein AYO40_04400 [Planctomycetaceae bacterium SCGC AG-212-D15]